MQPTGWHGPKLFERALLFLKDKARLDRNRLIAICSYLFLFFERAPRRARMGG